MKTVVIIPARLNSSRLPGKVLLDICGKPMVEYVYNAALKADAIDDVYIATDSIKVKDVCNSFTDNIIITDKNHQSGTDRIAEAIINIESDIIINVQGDEPFIESTVVREIYDLSVKNSINGDIIMNSAYKMISNLEADDPNIVKVVTDSEDIALYFSRAKVPYPRDYHFDNYKGHLGIYGFTKRSLAIFCNLPFAPLEVTEKLEQLRTLYHGYKIAMTKVETESFGIDTQEDLERAIRYHIL